MSANFDAAWKLLLGNEGGFVVDNGGPTRWGITEAVARRNGYAGDMTALPQSTAEAIAKTEYWDDLHLDNLPTWAAFQLLDFHYNGGPSYQLAQLVAGVPDDGKPGPLTEAAIAKMNPWEFVAKYNARRLRYFASLKQPQYANGRMNRIAANLQQGGLPE